MKCARCGTEARRAEARFCAHCGTPFPQPVAEPAAVATREDHQPVGTSVAALEASAIGDELGDPSASSTSEIRQSVDTPDDAESEMTPVQSQPIGDHPAGALSPASNGHRDPLPDDDIADFPTRTDIAPVDVQPTAMLPASVDEQLKAETRAPDPAVSDPQDDPQMGLAAEQEETVQLPSIGKQDEHRSPAIVDQEPTLVLSTPATPAHDTDRGAPGAAPGQSEVAGSRTMPADFTPFAVPPRPKAALRSTPSPKPLTSRQVSRPRKARTARSLALAGLVVLIVAVVIGGILIYQKAIASGKNLAAMTTYNDPAGHFSLQYPALWTAKPISNGVQLMDSTGTAELDVQSLPVTDHNTADSYIATEASKLNLSAPDHEQVGSIVWAKRSGLVTTNQGVSDEVVLLAYVQHGRVYLVKEVTPISNFANENRLAFLPALQSFQFK